MDQHTESGWKHDPAAPKKCEMNFRNNLTAFSWKLRNTRLRLGGASSQPNSKLATNGSNPLFDCRMVMLSWHRTARRNVEIRNQEFATALLGADANDRRLAGYRV